MALRRAVVRAGAIPSGLMGSRRRVASRLRPRTIEPQSKRSLPAEAGVPRSVPKRRVFRHHRVTIISYAFILIAAAVIFGVSYTTYAFSRYQGVVLPGVYVSNLPLGSDSWTEAQYAVLTRLAAMHEVPFVFTWDGHRYKATARQLNISYDVNTTIDNAYSIGRSADFWRNLFDRLPLHRHFTIGLITHVSPYRLKAWVQRRLVDRIHKPFVNATLVVSGDRVVVQSSSNGYRVSASAALRDIESSLGSLRVRRFDVPLVYRKPAVSDSLASSVSSRVNTFLGDPPVMRIGGRRILVPARTLASMLSFSDVVHAGSASVAMHIDTTALRGYVAGLAQCCDVTAENANLVFAGDRVITVSPRRVGRAMDQGTAYTRLLHAVKLLTPHALVHVPVRRVPPPVSSSQPASLGINSFLAEGSTGVSSSSSIRLADLAQIVLQLNSSAPVGPGQDLSFNTLAGTGWPPAYYDDTVVRSGGFDVPGTGGAAEQAATTFFRAGYLAGLPIVERHAPPYRVPWYSPAGLDATVSQVGQDVSFRNTTGGFLLVRARLNPVAQKLSIYLYGRRTGWKVTLGKVSETNRIPAGPPRMVHDPSLPKGIRRTAQYPEPGGTYTVTRVIRRPGRHGSPGSDRLTTQYQPRPAVILVGTGGSGLGHNPTPTASPTATSTPTPTPTATKP